MQKKPRTKLISKDNPETEYFEMLSSINANLVDDTRMVFIARKLMPVRNTKYLWIRHDVDHDLTKAVDMARAEAEYGYYSTYFLLHSAEYWDGPEFGRMVRELVTLGHSLGIHNNALATWRQNKSGPTPIEIIKNAKKRLEDLSGHPVYFTSSHGDRVCREKGFNNYDMWEESLSVSNGRWRNMGELTPTFLSSLHLNEAYFVRRDAYLTDSGYKWRGAIRKEIPTFEHFDKVIGAKDTVARFNHLPEGVMQLLVHPCWWEIK